MGVGAQRHALASLLLGMSRRINRPHGRSGRVRKILPSQGFKPQMIQHLVNRYNVWVISVYLLGLTLKRFYPLPTQCIHVFCVHLRKKNGSINCMVFVTESVYCAVRAEYLYSV